MIRGQEGFSYDGKRFIWKYEEEQVEIVISKYGATVGGEGRGGHGVYLSIQYYGKTNNHTCMCMTFRTNGIETVKLIENLLRKKEYKVLCKVLDYMVEQSGILSAIKGQRMMYESFKYKDEVSRNP